MNLYVTVGARLNQVCEQKTDTTTTYVVSDAFSCEVDLEPIASVLLGDSFSLSKP